MRAAIAKAMENEPEGPDRDYWTTGPDGQGDQGEVRHEEVQADAADGDAGPASAAAGSSSTCWRTRKARSPEGPAVRRIRSAG